MKGFVFILASVFLLGLASCKKCKNEDPRARVVNGGSKNVSVHIATSGGNTININNIDGGMTSEYRTYAEGEVEFTITIGNGGNTTTEVIKVTMENCYEYDINIDGNNQVTSVPTDRNE
ncbi:MAG: hypothetical protein GY810_30945 [Aureispira sp.]|nr:hypothetical protein [Aureispira sp.]